MAEVRIMEMLEDNFDLQTMCEFLEEQGLIDSYAIDWIGHCDVVAWVGGWNDLQISSGRSEWDAFVGMDFEDSDLEDYFEELCEKFELDIEEMQKEYGGEE